ncbi:MAG: KEOPS complex subunit Pcc1 [Thermoplasmata archaeon]
MLIERGRDRRPHARARSGERGGAGGHGLSRIPAHEGLPERRKALREVRREGVRCSVSLELEFASAGEARRVAAALEPDNEGFLRSRVEGRRLLVEGEAGTIPSLLQTLDDYLACLGVAVRAGGGCERRRGDKEEE